MSAAAARSSKNCGVDSVSRLHDRPEDLLVYECDAAALYKQPPLAVVFPETTEEVAAVVAACAAAGVPFLARGAGTGLSGGAQPVCGWRPDRHHRMRRILHVDVENRYAVVQPGVVNLSLSRAVAADGLYYAPDPSSQMACTIGGNVAENSADRTAEARHDDEAHSRSDGRVPTDASRCSAVRCRNATGYDLVGLFVGSDGYARHRDRDRRAARTPAAGVRTFLAAYAHMSDACATVAALIARGLDPAALEILDKLTIDAVEDSVYAAGYPREADAVLLVEVDGLSSEVEVVSREVAAICPRPTAGSICTKPAIPKRA
jgi:glycolate oxidase